MTRPLSIRTRFLIVSLVSVPVALALAALVMIRMFSANLESRIDAELVGDINILAGQLAFAADGGLVRPSGPLDQRFRVPYSGLYWQIEGQRQTQLRSQSLWDFALALPEKTVAGSSQRYSLPGPENTTLVAQERQVIIAAPSGRQTLRIVVAADTRPLDEALSALTIDILPYLLALATFLIAASLLQLTVGLQPLSALTSGLDRIRERRSERLDGRFPAEFAPMVEALNRLLDAQGAIIAKARTRAADLAHGLKTPLTILSNDALTLQEKGEIAIAGEIDHLVALMQSHIGRELTRSRIAASADLRQSDTEPGPIVDAIVRTLKRTPQGEMLDWSVTVADDIVLKIDPHDFRELAGNILENAGKWASSRISVVVAAQNGRPAFVVEDDGPGADPGQIGQMTQRGIRLDSRMPGTGLGLSIVREIADVYGLRLEIANRATGGLQVRVAF